MNYTNHDKKKKGTPITAVVTWIHFQSWSNQATSANIVVSIGQEGIAITHDRHRACVNSDIMLYCTVRWKPMATPMKSLTVANITQDVENTATMLRIIIDSKAIIIGGLRPTRSASWPQTRLPTNTPAIWTDVMTVGIQSLCSQTKDHWNNNKTKKKWESG